MKTFVKATIAVYFFAQFALATSAVYADDDNELVNVVVSLEQASSIARQQVEGTIISAEAESEDGVAVWEVEIVDADGAVYEVEIDASTGAVLEVEKDD